jgi:hypothetical protein
VVSKKVISRALTETFAAVWKDCCKVWDIVQQRIQGRVRDVSLVTGSNEGEEKLDRGSLSFESTKDSSIRR